MSPEKHVELVWHVWRTTPLTSLKTLMATQIKIAISEELEAMADHAKRWTADGIRARAKAIRESQP